MNILKILFGKRAETESQLKENEIFVFGSNILGHHNGSAAGMAVKMFGATYGKAEGLQGRSYAIPTDYISEHTDIHEIFKSVVRFTEFARQHPELTFLVTALGTGNAVIDPMQMASMFFGASKLPNVKLPKYGHENEMYNEGVSLKTMKSV